MKLATSFRHDSFGLRSALPLEDDQIRNVAPSIYAMQPHESRSDRYTYIPTIDVLNGLRREGFQPFQVVQSRSRIEGKSDFTKHMLRLRRESDIQRPEAFEVVLINSHDGTSSFQLLSGLLRFVCQNSCVAGDSIEDIRVSHRGNIIDNVIEAAYQVLDNSERVLGAADEMRALPMSRPEQEIFAEAALSLRYDEDKAPVTPDRILIPRRREDFGADLWTTFNVTQEHLTRGGDRGRNASGKRTTTRGISGISENVKLNRALWTLAERMADLKKEGVPVVPLAS